MTYLVTIISCYVFYFRENLDFWKKSVLKVIVQYSRYICSNATVNDKQTINLSKLYQFP